jgi:putative cardiolipin synthase
MTLGLRGCQRPVYLLTLSLGQPAQPGGRNAHQPTGDCMNIAASRLTRICLISLSVLIGACSSGAGLKEDYAGNSISYSLPPADSGILADIAAQVYREHGQEHSGFHLLDSSYDGLAWRLALIDSATTSIDIQTYLWYPDFSGRLLLQRAILAAERGVRVRLIVDDLLLQGHDQLIANLQAYPNLEFRLFNPWNERGSLAERAGQMLAEMERLNTRMHDKLMVVDGHAAVIGGRNIGDHYFGLSDKYNFHDTDLLGLGHIAQQSALAFDEFWNSQWVMSAEALTVAPDAEAVKQARATVEQIIADAPELEAFPRQPVNWSTQLNELAGQLHPGRSKLVFDRAEDEQIEKRMEASMFNFFNIAERELLIQNAYVIPSDEAIGFLEAKREAGVKVSLLTNSLASHDVPAVNSHYEPWRDDFIRSGVALWELRANPAIQSDIVDVPPVSAQFTGLHSKCAVADRRYVFIGSMNLDPRSRNINTEMGAMIDSPGLAEALASALERNMSGENAWRVDLDEEGNIFWENSDERLNRQPARDSMQRVMNVLMKLGPREQY